MRKNRISAAYLMALDGSMLARAREDASEATGHMLQTQRRKERKQGADGRSPAGIQPRLTTPVQSSTRELLLADESMLLHWGGHLRAMYRMMWVVPVPANITKEMQLDVNRLREPPGCMAAPVLPPCEK